MRRRSDGEETMEAVDQKRVESKGKGRNGGKMICKATSSQSGSFKGEERTRRRMQIQQRHRVRPRTSLKSASSRKRPL